MEPPLRVEVYRLEEVLISIYGEDLGGIDTEDATKAFMAWVSEHKAHYVVTPSPNDPMIIIHSILAAIGSHKYTVVLAKQATEEDL